MQLRKEKSEGGDPMASYTDPRPAYLHLGAPLSGWYSYFVGVPGDAGDEGQQVAFQAFPQGCARISLFSLEVRYRQFVTASLCACPLPKPAAVTPPPVCFSLA